MVLQKNFEDILDRKSKQLKSVTYDRKREKQKKLVKVTNHKSYKHLIRDDN